MNARILSALTGGLLGAAASGYGQAAATPGSEPPPASQEPTASSQISNAISADTNRAGSSVFALTNRAGQSFTADHLATQLRLLSATVDQTLPVLTAFNENFAAPGASSLSGGLTNLVSGVLRGNTTTNSSVTGQTQGTLESIFGAVRGLINTNANTAASNPNLAQQLVTLQSHLEALVPLLRNLNLGTVPGPNRVEPLSRPTLPGYPQATNGIPEPLTPTGR